jgi:hypothetical protein
MPFTLNQTHTSSFYAYVFFSLLLFVKQRTERGDAAAVSVHHATMTIEAPTMTGQLPPTTAGNKSTGLLPPATSGFLQMRYTMDLFFYHVCE